MDQNTGLVAGVEVERGNREGATHGGVEYPREGRRGSAYRRKAKKRHWTIPKTSPRGGRTVPPGKDGGETRTVLSGPRTVSEYRKGQDAGSVVEPRGRWDPYTSQPLLLSRRTGVGGSPRRGTGSRPTQDTDTWDPGHRGHVRSETPTPGSQGTGVPTRDTDTEGPGGAVTCHDSNRTVPGLRQTKLCTGSCRRQF